MRRAFLVLPLIIASACGGDSSKFASAAATAGLAVAAAAVNRAATGGCWAACPQGYECDEDSGTCVPLPCLNECPPDTHCVRFGSRETCERGSPDRVMETEIPPLPEDMPDAGADADAGAYASEPP